MLRVRVSHDQIRIGRHFTVGFQRTLRIPDDGHTYPLPPSLGNFPVCRVRDYADRVPASWREHGGVFIPMHQREALWMNFGGADWRPTAVKIAVGKVNALSGKPWSETLAAGTRDEQDYMVCPDQPWLDGINAGAGFTRQFVAMPLGMGYTVEGQVTGKEEFGGVQIIAFDPKRGRFPERAPRSRWGSSRMLMCCESAPGGTEMGLAAGGKMEQAIYPDPYGVDTWDVDNTGRVYVHIVNSLAFREITGMEAPPSPVSARTYAEHGLPWFSLYDEHKGDIAPAATLAGVTSVKGMDAKHGFTGQQDDEPVAIDDSQLVTLGAAGDDDDVGGGTW